MWLMKQTKVLWCEDWESWCRADVRKQLLMCLSICRSAFSAWVRDRVFVCGGVRKIRMNSILACGRLWLWQTLAMMTPTEFGLVHLQTNDHQLPSYFCTFCYLPWRCSLCWSAADQCVWCTDVHDSIHSQWDWQPVCDNVRNVNCLRYPLHSMFICLLVPTHLQGFQVGSFDLILFQLLYDVVSSTRKYF